ncbi:ArsR/SmtB family transcription factor [Phreatobacter aquaticus]|nr:metalloregulator ArsR/SmtB family transcription factor [Phreatobacter aquaticus]
MTDSCADKLTEAAKAELLLKPMAHAQRLVLLACMGRGELSSSTIAARAGFRLPIVSHHLGVLRNAGVIASRRDSREVFHRIISPEAQRVMEALGGRPADQAA